MADPGTLVAPQARVEQDPSDQGVYLMLGPGIRQDLNAALLEAVSSRSLVGVNFMVGDARDGEGIFGAEGLSLAYQVRKGEGAFRITPESIHALTINGLRLWARLETGGLTFCFPVRVGEIREPARAGERQPAPPAPDPAPTPAQDPVEVGPGPVARQDFPRKKVALAALGLVLLLALGFLLWQLWPRLFPAAPEAVVPAPAASERVDACALSQGDDAAVLKSCLGAAAGDERLRVLAEEALAAGRCELGKRIYMGMAHSGSPGFAWHYARYLDANSGVNSACVAKNNDSARQFYGKARELPGADLVAIDDAISKLK